LSGWSAKQTKRLLTLEPPLCREQLMAIEPEVSGRAESLPILPDWTPSAVNVPRIRRSRWNYRLAKIEW